MLLNGVVYQLGQVGLLGVSRREHGTTRVSSADLINLILIVQIRPHAESARGRLQVYLQM